MLLMLFPLILSIKQRLQEIDMGLLQRRGRDWSINEASPLKVIALNTNT